MRTISIDGRLVGDGQPPYIIAELSANHNGDIKKALETIKAAKDAGADAVKIQSYTPDTMTIDCSRSDFLISGGLWDGYKLYDLYKWAQTPFEWHEEIFEYARKIGITCFSTPFDETAVDLLEDLNVPAYKVASFEVTDLPLIRYIASKNKPIIMSTGMADLQEIRDAVEVIEAEGCGDKLVLLHCISSYPAPVEQSNLKTIPDMAKRFDVHVGLSDHSLTNTAAIASIALGATVIEKHFIIDRSDKGPDSEFSVEPKELEALCLHASEAASAIGQAGYERKAAEKENLKFRRSTYFVKDVKAGEAITPENLRRIRPGFGLAPKHYDELLGKTAAIDIEAGTATSWELVE